MTLPDYMRLEHMKNYNAQKEIGRDMDQSAVTYAYKNFFFRTTIESMDQVVDMAYHGTNYWGDLEERRLQRDA
jgi:hypothetical protein